jgi:transcriptional regulator with XRE-family HTH domain
MDRVIPYSTDMPPRPAETHAPDQSALAITVGQNLTALMRATKGLPNDKDLSSNPRLDNKVKLGTSALSRIRNGVGNPTLSTIEALAKAFGVEPWHLMVPGFDPKHLPTLQPLSERERQLYARFKQVAMELAEPPQ